MRTYILFLFYTIGFFFFSLRNAKAQYVTIPDANFRTYLEGRFPSCMQNGKMDTTCTEITTLKEFGVYKLTISDLTGIQYFDALEYFFCTYTPITFLPPLPKGLQRLHCSSSLLTTLPALPKSLEYLYCSSNQLTSLPPLPESLKYLECSFNQLTVLPSLPKSLIELQCVYNQLTFLPALPQSLINLQCWQNQLSGLPALPVSLERLGSGSNQLTDLPALPVSLRELTVEYNQITHLPVLPPGLEYLHCVNNQLEQLPVLPASLNYLGCSMNKLTTLPYLPQGLEELNCYENQLTALPYLPAALTSLQCFKNKINCLPVLPDGLTELITDSLCRPNMPAKLKTNIPKYDACPPLSFTHTRVCAGDSTAFILANANCHAFLWDFNDPVTGTNNTSTLQSAKHLFSKPGTFQVKLISYVSDPATVITKTVTVDKLPRIDFGDDHSMCPDDGIVLDAGKDFESYVWQDGSTAQSYKVAEAGTYSVTATNTCGAVSDAVTLRVYEVTIPNLFTPNKDGFNDRFEIAGLDGDRGILHVYNSWGGEVYSSERYYNNWNGEELPEGIYYYSFVLKSCPVKKGWVQIMR